MTNKNHREYQDIILSTLGRPDVNGMQKHPLTEEQLQTLAERAEQGVLTGECGHPQKELGGEAGKLWEKRILDVKLERMSHAITQIRAWMGDDPDGIGGKVQHITATIRPSGPFAEDIRTRLESGDPTYFGLRALTRVTEDGTHEIVTIISWDWIQNDPYPSRSARGESVE